MMHAFFELDDRGPQGGLVRSPPDMKGKERDYCKKRPVISFREAGFLLVCSNRWQIKGVV